MAYGDAPKTRSTALWLFLFFAAALALRIVFSVGVGFDEDSGRHIFTGNDPYYHDRALRHLMDTGENLDRDPSINYPDGRSNPNPPLYVWSAAPLAFGLEAGGAEDPSGLALNIMTGIWGALIVFPVFILARDLWGRGAGLWAAFFTAVSAPYIQRSVWGYADHDGFTMFFIALAFMFLVKAFRALKAREYVADWSKGASRMAGIKAAYTENKRAFLFASYAGLALTACALAWKGYPYALAVLAVAVGLQLIADHLRNRDSTATFLLYLVPLVLVIVLPWLLYYRMFPEFMDGTIFPSLYVLAGVAVAGLVLVPTRQIASIVIFPVLLVAGAIGLFLMLVVFPDVGYVVFSGLGYFNQSKLYTTIAEAQRAQLGFVAASFGFFTFLLGFWGYGKAVRSAWKGEPAFMLVASWATVAFFMAFAASRFVMNAVPIFAVLIGASMVALLTRMDVAEVARRWRGMHGQGIAARSVKSLGWKSGIGIALVGLLLVIPNVWIGVDAATPSEFDAKHGLTGNKVDRFGAFGISFDLRDNGWLETMAFLAAQDTGMPEADRPAVIAWWDYGHWNIGIGEHPTVADPFQSHYELAGRFLASESEEEGVSWLTILLVDYDYWVDGPGFSPEMRSALDAASPGLADTMAPVVAAWAYDPQYDALNAKVNGTAVFGLYEGVKDATGKDVGYMAADIRMYPFSACNSGIFYAPVFLANKNPDDFLSIRQTAGATTLSILQYGVDADGNSYRLASPRIVDQSGTEWEMYQGAAFQPGRTPLQGFPADSGVFIGDCRSQQMSPTAKFTNSMYARAFGSFSATVAPCNGMSHWRAVQQSVGNYYGIENSRATVLCEYYTGAQMSGTVRDGSGNPMANVQVSFRDGFGATHGAVLTGADGKYTVSAPFSQDGDLTLAVLAGGQVIYESDPVTVTREQATSGATLPGMDLTIASGSVNGRAYENKDGAAGFNATTDTPIAGATVRVAGKTATTGADGSYTIADVPAGAHTATVSAAGYNNGTAQALVRSGEASTVDVAMTVKTSTVSLRFLDNGQGVSAIPMQITGGALTAARTVTTNANGNATTTLPAGDYVAKVDYTVTIEGTEQHYVGETSFTVGAGGNAVSVVVNRQA
ncbi:MAG: STT3 domain-containing protein [Candidatus Thermoplasmatota archaeon]